MAFEKKELKKKSENVSAWYNDVLLKAEIADYGPVKGTMVIRPYGYSLWERIQDVFNGMIKPYGVGNAYFPMFIPMSLLEKEKTHVEGFSPELAVVTVGGGEELSEPLAVRPTSETIMYSMFKKWIGSYRDLPLLLNQWSNVVRWEKRTYLFLRTTEFLWQEGHTAHATHKEAVVMARKAHEWYRKIFEDYLALPVLLGIKSETEKFAGAVSTYTVETLMPDGKSLQSCTSHDLGQNFSKAFDVSFQNPKGTLEYVWQTSWGLSTRALGGMFLAHGDDDGLIMPPKMAPIQCIIIPIVKTGIDKKALFSYTDDCFSDLVALGVRVDIDKRELLSPGRKFNEWEIKGVPLRIEVGQKEMKNNEITFVVRDTHEKKTIGKAEFLGTVEHELSSLQLRLFEKQQTFVKKHTHEVSSWDHFTDIMKGERGYLKAFWCEENECEKIIKEKTKATTRCLPLDAGEEGLPAGRHGVCVHCGKPAKHRWIFGQSY